MGTCGAILGLSCSRELAAPDLIAKHSNPPTHWGHPQLPCSPLLHPIIMDLDPLFTYWPWRVYKRGFACRHRFASQNPPVQARLTHVFLADHYRHHHLGQMASPLQHHSVTHWHPGSVLWVQSSYCKYTPKTGLPWGVWGQLTSQKRNSLFSKNHFTIIIYFVLYNFPSFTCQTRVGLSGIIRQLSL